MGSTHAHYNINDGDAEAPKFYAPFHRSLACATKRDLAVFPYGTWFMRVFHDVNVEPPPQVAA